MRFSAAFELLLVPFAYYRIGTTFSSTFTHHFIISRPQILQETVESDSVGTISQRVGRELGLHPTKHILWKW
jgi:hypothetical protein